jgi:hypothetical protein
VTEKPTRGSRGLDVDHPNAARIYDAMLGGSTNYAIDRQFAEQAVRNLPIVNTLVRANREFLGRAVRYCARQGVTQFLDIGSGVPTAGNVHEVANELNEETRCVYVDFEPVAAAHCRLALEDHGDPQRHAVVEDDMLNVAEVWAQALATGVLDPTQPIALIMVAMLHFVLPGSGAHAAVQQYRELLPADSYLVISHATQSGVPDDLVPSLDTMEAQYSTSSTPVCYRRRKDIAAFFGDFDMIDPDLVWLPQWRLDERDSPASAQLAAAPERSCVLGGVGRKPPR